MQRADSKLHSLRSVDGNSENVKSQSKESRECNKTGIEYDVAGSSTNEGSQEREAEYIQDCDCYVEDD
jgi:hypothetical protein